MRVRPYLLMLKRNFKAGQIYEFKKNGSRETSHRFPCNPDYKYVKF